MNIKLRPTPTCRGSGYLVAWLDAHERFDATAGQSFQKSGRWQPICVSYASTRDTIEHHAWALRELVDNLPGKPRVAFVGHSLGNIVVRRALGLWQEDDLQGVLPRIERVVMLGPPNQGSALARQLSGLGVFEVITGASGQELGRVWKISNRNWQRPPAPSASWR